MSEHRLWEWLRDRLPSGHASRVESEITPGFPDVYFTMRHGKVRGITVVFELKFGKKTARCPLKKKIRQSQIDWHIEHERCGGIGWIVAEVGDRVFFIPSHWLTHAKLDQDSLLMLEHRSDLILKRRRDKPVDTMAAIRELILKHRRI